jgi:hypothetical protein
MGQLIRVNEIGAQRLEHLRHLRFSASDPACQSDEEHRFSAIQTQFEPFYHKMETVSSRVDYSYPLC